MDGTNQPTASQPTDLAADVLRNTPGISDIERADIWDMYHDSKDANELSQRLQQYATPGDVKYEILRAKKESAPRDALVAMSQLEPKLLALAEAHPNVLKALISIAAKS